MDHPGLAMALEDLKTLDTGVGEAERENHEKAAPRSTAPPLRRSARRDIPGIPVKTVRTIAQVRRLSRAAQGKVVLVPTMGALHAGHTALIDRARRLAGRTGLVVVSIFINPTQFGPKEDLARYPRPFAADRRLCVKHGADVIFHPSVDEMYPDGFSTFVDESQVSAPLCGASRPGHFRGVCTVVLKLFTAVEPNAAVFGLKDYQQCAVIRRMVRDLNLPVTLDFLPTVREKDGLALSSRNAYLTPEQRAQAAALRSGLLAAEKAHRAGENSVARLRRLVAQKIAESPFARVDYIEALDADSLQPIRSAERRTVIAAAVLFGSTRLIDNILI